jgi:hypothetical protein
MRTGDQFIQRENFCFPLVLVFYSLHRDNGQFLLVVRINAVALVRNVFILKIKRRLTNAK